MNIYSTPKFGNTQTTVAETAAEKVFPTVKRNVLGNVRSIRKPWGMKRLAEMPPEVRTAIADTRWQIRTEAEDASRQVFVRSLRDGGKVFYAVGDSTVDRVVFRPTGATPNRGSRLPQWVQNLNPKKKAAPLEFEKGTHYVDQEASRVAKNRATIEQEGPGAYQSERHPMQLPYVRNNVGVVNGIDHQLTHYLLPPTEGGHEASGYLHSNRFILDRTTENGVHTSVMTGAGPDENFGLASPELLKAAIRHASKAIK